MRENAVDDLGEAVGFGRPPSRIVSLVPSVTETLFALGAGNRIVAVTDYCDHPPEVAGLPRIGGVRDPRVDEIRNLRPDLVVASVLENDRSSVEAMRKLGLPVYLTGPKTVPEAVASIERLAEALGVSEAGGTLAFGLRRDLELVRARTELIPVLFPVWEDPLVLPGKATFVSDLLRRAGLVSAGEALGAGWPSAGTGFLGESGARAVVLPTEPFPYSEADVERWSSWDRVPPVARKNVFLVDGELTNRPGPRMTGGLAALAKIADAIDEAL